jgi:kynureninase
MQPIIMRLAVESMDARDPLAGCRQWFALPPGVIYLDGNSLGALPATTAARVARVVEDWGRDLCIKGAAEGAVATRRPLSAPSLGGKTGLDGREGMLRQEGLCPA